MKFLVLQKPRVGPPLTIEQLKASSEALEASVKILKEGKEKGKIECFYGIAGGGGLGIVNVDSHEELSNRIQGLPITNFGQLEVYALVDLEAVSENLKKMIEK
jgi:muconolactone delta-isomerase